MVVNPELPNYPFPGGGRPYDPVPRVNECQKACPVTEVRLPDSSAAWLVTGYEEARQIGVDARFSRERVFQSETTVYGTEPSLRGSIVALDPPEHTRLRRLVAGAFSETRVRDLQGGVADIVDGLLADMSRLPQPVDLVRHFSSRLSARVIALLLGITERDCDTFESLLSKLFDNWSIPQPANRRAYLQMASFLSGLAESRRASAAEGKDLISTLLQSGDGGEILSNEEIIQFCLGLLSAGYETTANQIVISLVALFDAPDQLKRLRQDPALIPSGTDELLRFVGISGNGFVPLARITRESVVLGGSEIPAGSIVLPMFDTSNRDHRIFANADELDVSRKARGHLAFGAGAHHCLGAQVARLQLREAFKALLITLPNLQIAVPIGELVFREDYRIASLKSLPVTWGDTSLE